MKVAKFGGTSLAGAEQIRKVCEIIAADPERRLIVVSAPGRRRAGDTKVTDLLIRLAEARLAGTAVEPALEAVVARYAEIASELEMPEGWAGEVEADLRARLADDRSAADRFMDRVKAAGEDHCARLVARYLVQCGVEAHYVHPREAGLLVTNEPGNARPLPAAYERLSALRERPGVLVFPGFFGYTPEGALMTFSRGGSDITGAILAAAVGAEVYENFTDVDGVFAADPALVEAPVPIAELTYREMRELSYTGFGVFHDEALHPVYRAGVPVRICNTNNPDAPGTRIVPRRSVTPGTVVGIASASGFCSVFVSKYLMNREVGFGRRLLQIFEDEGISYEHAPSGIDNISVILREADLPEGTEARVLERIRRELDVDDVSVARGLSLVMIVGEGMQHTIGMAARTAIALARAKVNIEMINQGSSEVSMMFGVQSGDAARAVRALYEEFFAKPIPKGPLDDFPPLPPVSERHA